MQQNELIHIECTTERFLEVAKENWPEKDLNPFICFNRLRYQTMSSSGAHIYSGAKKLFFYKKSFFLLFHIFFFLILSK